MVNFLNNTLAIVAAIASLRAAGISIFSTLHYDSFDRKLMPRNKSVITSIKQVTGVFLITIPTFIICSYLFGYFLSLTNSIKPLIYFCINILASLYIFSMVLTFTEKLIYRFKDFRYYNYVEKINPLFQFNKAWSGNLLFICMIAFLTLIAESHIFSTTSSILSKNMLIELFSVITVMSILILLMLIPFYLENKVKKYCLLPMIKTEQQLLEELGDNPIYLEYYLNESIAIYTTSKQQYKIIKRISGESLTHYEVYKSVHEDDN